MLLEHERNYVLAIDVLVIVCSWNTSETMFSDVFGMDAWTRWTAELAAHIGGRAKVLENPPQNTRRGPATSCVRFLQPLPSS